MLILTFALAVASHVAPEGRPERRTGGRIEGRVLDVKHAPAAGIRVILGEIGHSILIYNTPGEMFATTPGIFDPESQSFKAELATDRDGRFTATGLAPGEFSLIAADKERGIALASVRVEVDAAAKVEITLEAAGYLAAEITGLGCDPQRDTLELAPASQGSNILLVPRLAQRERQWSFESAPLPAIQGWRLIGAEVVTEQDYRATLFALPVSIAPGEHRRIVLDLAHGNEISGTVADARGLPLSGVSVVARASGDAPIEHGAVTDAKGRYRVRGLGEGQHTVEASRWKMRELVGCGNGSQDVFASKTAVLPLEKGLEVDFKVESLMRPPTPGDLAPPFTAVTLDGGKLDLAALRGKVVLIDFWATWCGMCRVDMPSLIETYGQFSRGGRFEIVGVSVDTDVGLVPRFIRSRRLAWPQTALGGAAQNPIARLYNVSSTPSTVLIDAEGRIAALNLTGEALRKKIEELLAPK